MVERQQRDTRFWVEKTILLVLLVIMLGISWSLWNYGEAEETVDTDSSLVEPVITSEQAADQSASTPEQQTPVAQPEQPVEAAFPFEFDGKNTKADFTGISEDLNTFTYSVGEGSDIEVSRAGRELASVSRDFIWEYELDSTGKLVLTQSAVSFCSTGESCGTGNGALEVIVQPNPTSDAKAIFYIRDVGDVSEFTVVEKYTPILESYKEIQG